MEAKALDMFGKTVKHEQELIWIKPVCDFFEINLQNQQRKLKKDNILGKLWTKKSTDLGKVDKNKRILLSKKGFVRWVQLINYKTVDKRLQGQFLQFQELIFDYLFGHAKKEEQAKIDYRRLKKLKSLYAKVGREIQKVEKGFSDYLEERFVQYKIDFNDSKKLKEA